MLLNPSLYFELCPIYEKKEQIESSSGLLGELYFITVNPGKGLILQNKRSDLEDSNCNSKNIESFTANSNFTAVHWLSDPADFFKLLYFLVVIHLAY